MFLLWSLIIACMAGVVIAAIWISLESGRDDEYGDPSRYDPAGKDGKGSDIDFRRWK
jgi:hypothetical protein